MSKVSESARSPAKPVADAPPSWPAVIATTLRLWLQRNMRLRPADRRLRRWTVVSSLIAVVLAVGALSWALAYGTAGNRSAGTRPASARRSSLAELAAANRQQAAAWITAQVSRHADVGCDPRMCAVLQADGFPAGRLHPLGPGAVSPLGSSLVIATPALRSQFGASLATVYAPEVIAGFGTGPAVVQVRVLAPRGARAYRAALRAGAAARRRAGRRLLHDSRLRASRAARADLAKGHVDGRLLRALAELAGRYRLRLLQFGDSGPAAPAGVLPRAADLGLPRTPAARARYLRAVLRFLRARPARFRPAFSVAGSGAVAVIRIEFGAPSPVGLPRFGSH
jgi:hypothetical protein